MTSKKLRAPKLWGLPPRVVSDYRWVWKFPGAIITVETLVGVEWDWNIVPTGRNGEVAAVRACALLKNRDEALASLRRFLRCFGKLVREAT